MIDDAAALSAMIGHWPDFSIVMVLLIYNAVSGFLLAGAQGQRCPGRIEGRHGAEGASTA